MGSSPLAHSGLPARVANALQQLMLLAHSEFQPRLLLMLELLDNTLLQTAERSRNPVEQGDLLRAIQCLNAQRDAFAPAFFRQLEADLARLRQDKAEAAPTSSSAPDSSAAWTLADADSDGTNEAARLRELALPLEGRLSLPLYLMGQRFGVLAAAPAFTAHNLPLAPRHLLQTAADTARSLFLGQVPSTLFLAAFAERVLPHYPIFLEKAAAALEQAGILPGLTFVPARVNRSEQAATRPPAATAASTPPPAEPPPTAVPQAAPGPTFAPAGLAPTTGQAAMQPPLAWLEQPLPAASTAAGTADFRLLQQLLSARRYASGRLPAAPAASRALPPEELAGLLAQLREQPALTHGSLEGLRTALLQAIQSRHGEAAGLDRETDDGIELLAMLLRQVGTEIRSDSMAHGLLQRLQLPLLHTVLEGREFFENPEHPARQILNTIAEYDAQLVGEHMADPAFEAAMEAAITRLEQAAKPGREAFAEVNQELQAQLQQQIRRAQSSEKRHIEAMCGRERLATAKSIASEALESRMRELLLSPPIQTLLRHAWLDALTLALLRHGLPSHAWSAHLARTEEILALQTQTQPATSAELAREVEAALQRVGYHDHDAGAMAKHLARSPATPAEPHESAAENIAEHIKAQVRFAAENPDDDLPPVNPSLPARSAEEEACYQQLTTLPFGTWLDFVADSGEITRQRFSWYSKLSGHALLVNRRGQRTAVLHLDTLARKMAKGEVRLPAPHQLRLVDRALNATVTTLQNLLRGGIRMAHNPETR